MNEKVSYYAIFSIDLAVSVLQVMHFYVLSRLEKTVVLKVSREDK